MSDTQQQDITTLSPDKLMTGFARTRIWLFLLAAVGIHVLVGVGTSVGYIRDTWIDPEGAALRKAQAAQQSQQAVEQATEPAPAQAASRPAAQADDEHARLLEENKDASVVKNVTRTARPEEIPDRPEDLGISIDDTNPR